MNYLCIDVGTTRCKCQLFDDKGNILHYIVNDYSLKTIDGEQYVDIYSIKDQVFGLIKQVSQKYTFDSVAVSSFGESFVLLDKDDNVLFLPMLYTDARGEDEANVLIEHFGQEKMFEVTGVLPASMYSISKIMWIKNHQPETFIKANKILLICDYMGYLLTGIRAIDYALAARTGAFDIEKKDYSKEVLSFAGIDIDKFSKPMPTGSIVGELTDDIKAELGLKGSCKLVLGSHDQVCAALGAGIINAGEAIDGMGTVECIVAVFKDKPTNMKMCSQGYPIIPYLNGLYCTYILNYSCGSITGWLKDKIFHGYKGEEENFFSYIEKDMTDKPSGLLFLPYLGGAATPYQDINAKGAIIGITATTTASELYKSVMEGTSFEMRLNADTVKEYGIDVTSLTATGGGANSDKWLQIKADIQNVTVDTLRSSEGGLCGLAILSAVALGGAKDLVSAKEIFVKKNKMFVPNAKSHADYESSYKKYTELYKTVKNLY